MSHIDASHDLEFFQLVLGSGYGLMSDSLAGVFMQIVSLDG